MRYHWSYQIILLCRTFCIQPYNTLLVYSNVPRLISSQIIVKPCWYVYLQASVARIARMSDFSNFGFKKSKKDNKIRDIAYEEKIQFKYKVNKNVIIFCLIWGYGIFEWLSWVPFVLSVHQKKIALDGYVNPNKRVFLVEWVSHFWNFKYRDIFGYE